MAFKEFLEKVRGKDKEKKEMLKRMLQEQELQTIVEERQKSSNQRELERYINEKREAEIKEALEVARKERSNDIRFNHNPLNVKNITNSTQWEVLKERNQFNKRGNMFANQKNIHKSNPKLLKSGNILHGKNMFKSKGGNFI